MKWLRAIGIAPGKKEERVVICGHQITNVKDASESLAERRLLSLPENAFVFIQDEVKRYCFMNQSLLKLLGKELSHVIGKTSKELGIHRLIEILQPRPHEDVLLPAVDYEEVRVNDRKLKLMTIRMKIPINSNSISLWAAANSEASQTHLTLGIAWDLSKAEDLSLVEAARSAWAKLLSSSKDAIYIKEAKTRKYGMVNETFAKRVKMKVSEITGKKADEIEMLRRYPSLLKAIAEEDESLARGKTRFRQTFRKRMGDGGRVWYELSSKIAITNPSEKVEYILGISREATEEMSQFLQQ